MAALPLTGISVSLVRNTIGASSNDVATLFLHPNVNEFGFNNPDAGIQDALWGSTIYYRESLSPNSVNYQQVAGYKPGYHLHAFRGYDHEWKAYQFDSLVKTSGDEYYAPMTFTVTIKEAAVKLQPLADPAGVEIPVKIEFKRDSVLSTWTDMGTVNVPVSTKSSTIQFQAENPPDFATNGPLAQSEGFTLRASVVSAPERRWYEGDYPILLLSETAPTSLYTNTHNIANSTAVAVEQTTPFPATIFTVETDVYADYYSARNLAVTATMSDTSNFANTYYPASGESISVPQSPTPGTRTYVDTAQFDFSASGISSVVGVGSTVYIRIFVEGIQLISFSTVVTDTIPT